jgi:MoxR-like ATPase
MNTGNLAALLQSLELGLVERRDELRAVVLAALAGEHVLLVGPPGTAKSLLARRVHAAFANARYFERLLTRFSVPEELFGPLSLAALEQDRYERRTEGYLPSVEFAFIDEVFKANSAILNGLLTLLNEREFDNGQGRMRVPLRALLAASNERPDDEGLAAIADRFLVCVRVQAVSDDKFGDLLQSEAERPPDVPTAQRLSLATLEQIQTHARSLSVAPEVLAALTALRTDLRDHGLAFSDRRWKKALKLMRTAAATCGREQVSVWDMCVLPWCLPVTAERERALGDAIAGALGIIDGFQPTHFQRAIDALCAQLESDENATELKFDEGGKLSFTRDLAEREASISAPRLSSALRKRRYGERHVAGRRVQVEALAREAGTYLSRLDARIADFDTVREHHLWCPAAFAKRVSQALAQARQSMGTCQDALDALNERIEALPRIDSDTSRHAVG